MPSRLNDLSSFLKLVLLSGWVKAEAEDKPVSAMLVARFESGKTSLLNQFSDCNGVLYLTDVTEYGLLRDYRSELVERKVRHIVIPDFIKCISRKKETVDTLITFFNSLVEEGIHNISTYATRIRLKEPLRCGLITSVAVDDFASMRKRLVAIGFLSRFMVMSYDYDEAHIDKVFRDIAAGEGGWSKADLNLPSADVPVHLPPELAAQMIPQARRIGARLRGYGFRTQHQFQQLAKAAALGAGRTTVEMEDVVQVLRLSEDYLGLRYHKVGPDGKVVTPRAPLL